MTYLVYAYVIIATVFLVLGFFLLLLGANPATDFVSFVYRIAAHFLEPFRGIFPSHQLSDSSYFSSAGLFAIIIYGIGAMAIHAFINYLTYKMQKHQLELEEYQERHEAAEQQRAQAKRSSAPSTSQAKSPQPRKRI